MVFPETYPDQPPKVRFTSEIFHPNGTKRRGCQVTLTGSEPVYGDGSICLDILQTNWSPINTVETVLVRFAIPTLVPCPYFFCALCSIRSLLTDPNPNSPANPIAAALFKNDLKEYNKRVKAIVERSLDV